MASCKVHPIHEKTAPQSAIEAFRDRQHAISLQALSLVHPTQMRPPDAEIYRVKGLDFVRGYRSWFGLAEVSMNLFKSMVFPNFPADDGLHRRVGFQKSGVHSNGLGFQESMSFDHEQDVLKDFLMNR